jgi:hypothetical protein
LREPIPRPQQAAALDDLVARRSIQCEERDVDQYGRTVAECFVASLSLNDELVKRGWAVAYREYSEAHVTAEEAARAAKRGVCPAPSRCRLNGDRSVVVNAVPIPPHLPTKAGMVVRSRATSAAADRRSIISG